MHFSAKRGLAIACRPSVTLVDCDNIGSKYWKVIAQTISPALSLFEAKRRSTYFRETWGNFGETRGGVGKKWHAGEQKWQYLKRVKIEEKLLWTAYRNSPTLFRVVPFLAGKRVHIDEWSVW